MFYVHETNNDVELGHLTRMTQAARRHCESPQLIWKELRGPPPHGDDESLGNSGSDAPFVQASRI